MIENNYTVQLWNHKEIRRKANDSYQLPITGSPGVERVSRTINDPFFFYAWSYTLKPVGGILIVMVIQLRMIWNFIKQDIKYHRSENKTHIHLV